MGCGCPSTVALEWGLDPSASRPGDCGCGGEPCPCGCTGRANELHEFGVWSAGSFAASASGALVGRAVESDDGESDDDASETVVVQADDGGDSDRMDGPIFHPIVSTGPIFIPGDEVVIIQRPPDVGDDMSGGGGADEGGDQPDGYPLLDQPKASGKRCCECLAEANAGTSEATNKASFQAYFRLLGKEGVLTPDEVDHCQYRYASSNAERRNWCIWNMCPPIMPRCDGRREL